MCCRRAGTKSMTGKRAEGMASGESKRAMAAGAGGILRTGIKLPAIYHTKSLFGPIIKILQIIKCQLFPIGNRWKKIFINTY